MNLKSFSQYNHIHVLISRWLITILLISYLPLQSQNLLSDSIDVTHYDIQISNLDFVQKQIQARTNLTITPKQSQLQGICLELMKLQIDSIFIDSTHLTAYTYDDTLLCFDLPNVLLYGDTVVIQVQYHGKPHVESYNWGGFHFQGTDYAFNLGIAIADVPHNYGKVWFPCVDDFRDRATYTCHIRVPQGYTAVCGGELVEVTTESSGHRIYHWHLDKPIPTYLASVAVSDYIAIQDTFQGMSHPIPVDIYVRPADSLKAKQSFLNLHPIIDLFEQHFGPYPWNRVGFVAAPKGAMEHVTNITYPRNYIDGTLSYEYLIAHELSHMWFGNLVTCDNAGDMWLNEGWASFCEFIYRECLYGEDDRKSYVRKKLRNILQNLHVEENGYLPLTNMPLNLTYGTSVYTKGACVAHSLRAYLGDSVFFPAVRAYLDSFYLQPATTNDLRDVLSYHSGIALQDFFDAWVERPGFLHFHLDSFRVLPLSMPPSFSIEVSFRQRTKGPAQVSLQNKVELLFMDQSWNKFYEVVTFDGPAAQVVVEVPFIPKVVFLDPHEKLCDAITDELKLLKTPGKKVFAESFFEVDVIALPDSGLIQASHHWVAPDPLEVPVTGFRLSNYRFWSVKGIFPDGFKAKGRFYYSRFTNLDGGIILNQKDSVVLMYRPGSGYPWQIHPATMEGVTYQGWLIVDSLLQGEYTIGVWDHNYLGTGDLPKRKDLFEIYPNPSDGSFYFKKSERVDETLRLRIYGSTGQVVANYTLQANQDNWIWHPQNNVSGAYYVEVSNRKGARLWSTTLLKI